MALTIRALVLAEKAKHKAAKKLGVENLSELIVSDAEVATIGSIRSDKVATLGGVEFEDTIKHAFKTITNQLEVASSADPVTMGDVELRKAQSALVIDAVEKGLEIASLKELVQADQYKFKRGEELDVLNPLLDALKIGSVGSKLTVAFIVEQIHSELQAELPNIERLSLLQTAYRTALEDIGETVKTLDKTIQLERKSGGRQWGAPKKERQPTHREILAMYPPRPMDDKSRSLIDRLKGKSSAVVPVSDNRGTVTGNIADQREKPVKKLTDVDIKNLVDGKLKLRVRSQDEAGSDEEINLGIPGSSLDLGLDVDIDGEHEEGAEGEEGVDEELGLGLGLGFESDN